MYDYCQDCYILALLCTNLSTTSLSQAVWLLLCFECWWASNCPDDIVQLMFIIRFYFYFEKLCWFKATSMRVHSRWATEHRLCVFTDSCLGLSNWLTSTALRIDCPKTFFSLELWGHLDFWHPIDTTTSEMTWIVSDGALKSFATLAGSIV